MLVLHEFQKQFIQGLRQQSDQILNYIDSNSQLTVNAKLDIYRSSIVGALQKSLIECFPVCYKLVGKDFFILLVDEYIFATHSTSPDLGEFGKDFSEFIKNLKNSNIPPYLSDVANLEWALHKTFNAPDYSVLNLNTLNQAAATDGDRIVFVLPPQSYLLASQYPLLKIWEMNQDSYTDNETILLDNNCQYYFFIWRYQLENRIEPITYNEWQILNWIQSGLTMAEICHQADDTIIESLTSCMQKQWLVDFKII